MAVKSEIMKKMHLEMSRIIIAKREQTEKNNLDHNRSQNDETARTWTRSIRRTRSCANRRGVAAGWLLRRGDLLLDGGGDPLADNGCSDHKGHDCDHRGGWRLYT